MSYYGGSEEQYIRVREPLMEANVALHFGRIKDDGKLNDIKGNSQNMDDEAVGTS